MQFIYILLCYILKNKTLIFIYCMDWCLSHHLVWELISACIIILHYGEGECEKPFKIMLYFSMSCPFRVIYLVKLPLQFVKMKERIWFW